MHIVDSHETRSTPIRNASLSVVVTDSIGLEKVLDLVRNTAGGAVDADAPLMEAGVDSLGAVELRTQLQAAVGDSQSLPSTVVFDHPTARALATAVSNRPQQPQVTILTGLDEARVSALVTMRSTRAALPCGAGTGLDNVRNCVRHGYRGAEFSLGSCLWRTQCPEAVSLCFAHARLGTL